MKNCYTPLDKIIGIYSDDKNNNCLDYFEWGWMPSDDVHLNWRGKLYNIRSETLLDTASQHLENINLLSKNKTLKASYLKALLKNRAVIPANILEESQRIEGRKTGKNFSMRSKNQDSMCIAAIYSDVIPQSPLSNGYKNPIRTIGMITTHHPEIGRIPLLLNYETALDVWLNCSLNQISSIIPFLMSDDREQYDLELIDKKTESKQQMQLI